jgi:hypothetical protein
LCWFLGFEVDEVKKYDGVLCWFLEVKKDDEVLCWFLEVKKDDGVLC